MHPLAVKLQPVLLRRANGELVTLDESFMSGLQAAILALSNIEAVCHAAMAKVGEARTDREAVLLTALQSLVDERPLSS